MGLENEIIGLVMLGAMLFAIFVGFPISFTLIFLGIVFGAWGFGIKLTVFLTDLGNFATVNSVMDSYFEQPFPARAAVGVASLPKGVDVEADAIIALPN